MNQLPIEKEHAEKGTKYLGEVYSMIFKVYYQETLSEVPVRERTQSLYVEAENVREVRKKLAPRKYNIEFVERVEGQYLEHEKQSEQFEVERI
jgi:DNA-dependent RNA polymerase auxiliary subunit epsilon